MANYKLGAVIALSAIAVSLAGCSSSNRIAKSKVQTPQLTMNSAPASGITAVKDVVVRPQPAGTVQFEASSTSAFSFDDLIAVINCRADQYKAANAFDAWSTVFIERHSNSGADSPQLGIAAIEFYKAPLPEKMILSKEDWCKKVPAAALAGDAPKAN